MSIIITLRYNERKKQKIEIAYANYPKQLQESSDPNNYTLGYT